MRAVVLGLALLLAGCGGLNLRDLARADVERAREIAAAAGDQAGVTCAQTILQTLAPRGDSPPPAGVFSAFMAARQLRRGREAGVPDVVRQACAVVVLDAQRTAVKLGAAVAPGGGIAGLLTGGW